MGTCYAHIFQDGEKRAANPYRKTCSILRENPLVGAPVEAMEGVRKLSIPRTPFALIYRIVDGFVDMPRLGLQIFGDH